MLNASEGQFEWTPDDTPTQPLSLIQEGNNAPTEGDGLPDFNVRTPYSPTETNKLFKVYVSTSKDPVVGTNHTEKRFWERLTQSYNAKRPTGTVERNVSILRYHFARASDEIQKFNGWYINKMKTSISITGEVDVMIAAMLFFQETMHRPFKHVSTWNKVRHLDKWAGDT